MKKLLLSLCVISLLTAGLVACHKTTPAQQLQKEENSYGKLSQSMKT